MKDVNNQCRDNEKQKMKETCKEQQKKDRQKVARGTEAIVKW